MRRVLRSSIVVGVLLAAGFVAARAVTGAGAATTPPATTLTVDAATDQGAFNNPGWYQNFTQLGPNGLARVDELAPRVGRGWGNTQWYYDETTGQYSFNDTTFSQADQYADRMVVNFGQCDQSLMTLADPTTCRSVLKTGIAHYKALHPGLQYVEFFNEPDKNWPLGANEEPPLSNADYYQWYKIGYQVVNELNAELTPTIPLRIGGPVTFYFDAAYLKQFLVDFRNDTDPAKRLDFLSYHQYSHGADPQTVAYEKGSVKGWLTADGLNPATPVFVTEYGVFGGPNGTSNLPADQVTQSAAMATLGNYYAHSGLDMPMQWVYVHDTNIRKSMFVGGDTGQVYPYYNLVKMERMLGSRLLPPATSTTLSAAGIGVNGLATRDDNRIAVLATNYQWTTGADTRSVTLKVTGAPAAFTGRSVTVQRYLVDATTSNVNANPATSELQLVEEYQVAAGATLTSRAFTLTPNAVSLLVLTPSVFSEGEALTPATSIGDPVTTIADTSASAGRLSLFGADAVGDWATYTLTVPKAGHFEVKARLKRTATRGVVQLSVDGKALGAPLDTSFDGYEFTDDSFGTLDLAAGAHTLKFTVVGPGAHGGGYAVGVDTLTLAAPVTYRMEAEDRMPFSPSGDPLYLLSDATASYGGYLKANTDAVGDSFQFTVMAPVAGTFDLWAGARYLGTRGTARFSVGGVTIGSLDEYASPAHAGPARIGRITVAAPGPLTITCTLTGKAAASTGYDYGLDYVELRTP